MKVINERVEKMVDKYVEKLISEKKLCPSCMRENGEHENFCLANKPNVLKTFVKVQEIKETKMMEFDSSRWYPVVEIHKDRIKVADYRGGFSFSEFPKKWVVAAKQE